MTKQEQQDFVTDLTSKVLQEMLQDIGKLPESWDGIELRRWVALRFSRCVMGDMPKGRKRAYENDVLINNL